MIRVCEVLWHKGSSVQQIFSIQLWENRDLRFPVVWILQNFQLKALLLEEFSSTYRKGEAKAFSSSSVIFILKKRKNPHSERLGPRVWRLVYCCFNQTSYVHSLTNYLIFKLCRYICLCRNWTNLLGGLTLIQEEINTTQVIRAFINSLKLLKLKSTLERQLMQSY